MKYTSEYIIAHYDVVIKDVEGYPMHFKGNGLSDIFKLKAMADALGRTCVVYKNGSPISDEVVARSSAYRKMKESVGVPKSSSENEAKSNVETARIRINAFDRNSSAALSESVEVSSVDQYLQKIDAFEKQIKFSNYYFDNEYLEGDRYLANECLKTV